MKIKIPNTLRLFLLALIVLLGIGVLLKYSPVYAQWDDWKSYVPGDLQSNTLEGYIQSIINAALVLAGVVAVVYLIIGGYQYVTSSGNAEAATTAKGTIMNAIIGLVVIFASYVLIDFVMTKVIKYGGSTGTTPSPTTTSPTPSTSPTPTPTPAPTPTEETPTSPSHGGVEV